MASSRFSRIWKRLRAADVDQDTVDAFQQFLQDEEFDFDGLIDDINDDDDESSISQWFIDNDYDEFKKFQKIITPKSYNPTTKKAMKAKKKKVRIIDMDTDDLKKEMQKDKDNKKDDDDDDNSDKDDDDSDFDHTDDDFDDNDDNGDADDNKDKDKDPNWGVIAPKVVKGKSIIVDDDGKYDANYTLSQIDPLNTSSFVGVLANYLDFENKPDIAIDLIKKLQVYTKMSTLDVLNTGKAGDASNNASQAQPQPPVVPFQVVSASDLHLVQSALTRLKLYTASELNEFVRYCEEEGYGETELVDDIEVFEEGDSAIMENMNSEFDWDNNKQSQFVNNLRDILGIRKVTAILKKTNSYAAMNMTANIFTAGQDKQPDNTLIARYNNRGDLVVNVAQKNKVNTIIEEEEEFDSDDSNNNNSGNKQQLINFDPIEVSELPRPCYFTTPESILKKKNAANLDDIETAMVANKVSDKMIKVLIQHCEEQKMNNIVVWSSSADKGGKFKLKYPSIGNKILNYMNKLQYELCPPQFRPSSWTKSDEKKYGKLMEKQCPGAIKHDRDLLKYFLLTKETSHDMGITLVDIVDRISAHDEYQLDLGVFTKKAFFNKLNKQQISIIKNGLRTYHNRFFPRLTMSPLSLIADRISDYQKYMIICTNFIKRAIDEEYIEEPSLVDFCIIPPGIYNKVINNFTALRSVNLGDIEKHLKDYNNKTYLKQTGLINGGLTDNKNNFTENDILRIVNSILEGIKHVTDNLKNKQKRYQRFVIIIDRRWRIMSKKWVIYNKLRNVHQIDQYEHSVTNKGTYDYNEYKNDDGLTHASGLADADPDMQSDDDYDDDDDDDNYGGGNDQGLSGKRCSIKFNKPEYKNFISNDITSDTIYVFQPKLNKRPIGFFNYDYVEETMAYLTKQCILPRKRATIQSYQDLTSSAHTHYNDMDIGGNSMSTSYDEDYAPLTHLGGDTANVPIWNLSLHVHAPYPNDIWYKYKIKYYLYTQSASIRFFTVDLTKLWMKYFVDSDRDISKLNADEIKNTLELDLTQIDPAFKRWFYAIKRSMDKF